MNSTECFFTLTAFDEAAVEVASLVTPASAADIVQATLASGIFGHDVQAVASFDGIVRTLSAEIPDAEVREKINPLFLSGNIQDVDDMLELQLKTDGIRFTGMDGNPFTIKMADVRRRNLPVLLGKVQSLPFELPPYSDLALEYERNNLN
jgi:hypothetical protein